MSGNCQTSEVFLWKVVTQVGPQGTEMLEIPKEGG